MKILTHDPGRAVHYEMIKTLGERTSLVNFTFNVQFVGCSKSLEEPFLIGGCVLSYKISGVWIPSR